MLRIKGNSLLASVVMVLSLGWFVSSCTDDKQPEEPVLSEASEIPAAPPMGEEKEMFSPEVLYFAYDSDEITMESQDKLRGLTEYMNKNQMANLQVEGHCDERGSVQYNLALGERRAQAVKNYLASTGVDAGRISTISWGKEKPAVIGKDESAWSKNRRAEFNLMEN